MTAVDAARALRDGVAVAVEAAQSGLVDANRSLAALQQTLTDAQRLVTELEQGGQPPADPPSDPPVLVPAGANTVRIGAASYPLAAVNPTRGDYPGGRGPDELVAYIAPVAFTVTNAFGTECTVMAGRVIAAVDREAVKQSTGVIVPTGGVVLSGHGRARAWLNQYAARGAAVEFATVDTPTQAQPTPAPAPGGRASNISVWAMLWPNSPRVDLGALPLEIDELRLAFVNGGGVIVGYGPFGLDGLRSQLQTFLAARPGRFISASIGGGGYEVDVSTPAGFIRNLKAIEKDLGITWGGINWDWESGKFKGSADNCIAISRQLRAERPGFYRSWSPNGSFKWDYRDALHAAPDVVDELAFQNYDTPVSFETAASIISSFLGNGKLKPEQIGIGQMIGAGSNYWTLAQCVDYCTRLRGQFGVAKTNYWEVGRPPLAEWAAAMRRINP